MYFVPYCPTSNIFLSFRLTYERDVVVNVKFEQEKTAHVCEQEEEKIERLKQVLTLVESLETRSQGDGEPLTLAEVAKALTRFQDEFYEEYHMYNLSTLAVALVFPMVSLAATRWR